MKNWIVFCLYIFAGVFSIAFGTAIGLHHLGHDWDRMLFAIPIGQILGISEVILGIIAGVFIVKEAVVRVFKDEVFC